MVEDGGGFQFTLTPSCPSSSKPPPYHGGRIINETCLGLHIGKGWWGGHGGGVGREIYIYKYVCSFGKLDEQRLPDWDGGRIRDIIHMLRGERKRRGDAWEKRHDQPCPLPPPFHASSVPSVPFSTSMEKSPDSSPVRPGQLLVR